MRKRTEEQWRELIQLHTQSGLTIKAFCIEQKISISNFYKFKKQFKSPLITIRDHTCFCCVTQT